MANEEMNAGDEPSVGAEQIAAHVPTIAKAKLAFLNRTTRELSQPLGVPRKTLEKAVATGIPKSVIDDVMQKVNRDLRQHSGYVWNTLLKVHVAEQIDNLYWNNAAPDLETEAGAEADIQKEDEGRLYVGDDLTLDENIAKLPAVWSTASDPPSINDSEDDDEEVTQDDYMTAHTRLQDLSAKRLGLQQKLTTYRTLLQLLEPYKEPQENIQPNLVTRDSPLYTELQKMKVLAIRAKGKIEEARNEQENGVGARNQDEYDDEDMDEDPNEKVRRVLAGW